MSNEWTLGFVGAGVMAEVMFSGLFGETGWSADRITASDRHPERLAHLAQTYPGMQVASDNRDAAQCDVVVLAIKPQMDITDYNEAVAVAR